MPPKDDEDPKSTKDVVTKKQKQLLNREELDLSLIAEAFGGVIVEAESKNSPYDDIEQMTRKTREDLLRRMRSGSLFSSKAGYDPAWPTDEAEQERIRREKSSDVESRPGRKKRERGTGRTKITKSTVTKTPDKPISSSQAAAVDYEDDLRRGRTAPGGEPRPTTGPEGRKNFNQLINDMKKSEKGKPLVPRTPPSVPQRVQQQRAQEYRAQGGGRRGQYLRRTGRLPVTSAPTAPAKPTASKPTAGVPKWLSRFSNQAFKMSDVKNPRLKTARGPGVVAAVASELSPYFTDYISKQAIKGIAKLTGQEKKTRQIQPSLYGAQGPDLSADITRRLRTQTKTQTQTQTQRDIKPPVIAPPITGIPRGRGGDQTRPGRGRPSGTKKDRKPRFGFPDQPGGVIGRRQNPQ